MREGYFVFMTFLGLMSFGGFTAHIGYLRYKFLNDSKADALDLSLKFVLNQEWIDKIVVGVDGASQLKKLLEIEKSPVSPDFPLLGCDDQNLIDPSKWKLA